MHKTQVRHESKMSMVLFELEGIQPVDGMRVSRNGMWYRLEMVYFHFENQTWQCIGKNLTAQELYRI